MSEVKLTPKQARFVAEYLIDLNATQAAIRAGYSQKTARSIAEENLTKPDIQKAIQKRMQERQERTEITADDVLKQWAGIAFADASELMEMRRVCCRYCHGKDFQYQYTPAEFTRKHGESEAANEDEMNVLGGLDYDRTKSPHPKCPECFGEGELQAFFKDTRQVKGKAKKLFAGVKISKDGTQVIVHDQMAALANIARHLGMFTEKSAVDLTTAGKPLPGPTSITPEQLTEIVRKVKDEY